MALESMLVPILLWLFWSLQEMEDTLKGWFAEFHTYLSYNNPALADKDPDKETAIDGVKAAVCQNINLFMEQNEEEFKDYLNTFVQDVWTLLVAVKQGSGQVQQVASDQGYAEQSFVAAMLAMQPKGLVASWHQSSAVCVLAAMLVSSYDSKC